MPADETIDVVVGRATELRQVPADRSVHA
jgi:hypothetical protein